MPRLKRPTAGDLVAEFLLIAELLEVEGIGHVWLEIPILA